MSKDITAWLKINPHDRGEYEIIHCDKGLIATCPTREIALKVCVALTYFRKAQEADGPDRWLNQFSEMIADLPKAKRKIALHHLDKLLERIGIWKEQMTNEKRNTE